MMNKLKQVVKVVISLFAYLICTIYLVKLYIPIYTYKDICIDISKYSGIFGVYIRMHFYNLTLDKCGDNLVVGYGSYFCYKTSQVGNNVCIEENCVISNCIIGNLVVVAANVSIMSGSNHHDIDDLNTPLMYSEGDISNISIGTNIWIGTHAVVMADITDGTVVGASSVVISTFQKDSVIAGVPARLIRRRGNSA